MKAICQAMQRPDSGKFISTFSQPLVFRSVAKLGCLARISDPNFSIPDPGIKKIPEPEYWARIRVKEFKCSSRIRIFPIPDPGSRGQRSTGSRIQHWFSENRNTGLEQNDIVGIEVYQLILSPISPNVASDV
jgi:hypothetical protein